MIAVIADDFTGAAEIGGIGLRHGLKVVIETEVVCYPNVDLLIIATDTRSMQASQAAEVVSTITQKLLALQPRFIFKKIDSALRGHIYDELSAQMEMSGCTSVLVVPGNPVFHRLVVNGYYTINNVPLDKTGFATDPDFPMLSAFVPDIIGSKGKQLSFSIKPGQKLPNEGLMIADVTSAEDLDYWAHCINSTIIPAGGSGFFNALLKESGLLKTPNSEELKPFGKIALYVLGSSYPKGSELISSLRKKGLFVSEMPDAVYYNPDINDLAVAQWANEIVESLKACSKVVLVVSQPAIGDIYISNRIKYCFSEVVRLVLECIEPDELFIEGGGTTSAILNSLHVGKLFPFQEFDTGIIRMRVDNHPQLCLTTKPGSYKWPDEVWS